jgi:hypothetical protein
MPPRWPDGKWSIAAPTKTGPVSMPMSVTERMSPIAAPVALFGVYSRASSGCTTFNDGAGGLPMRLIRCDE